MCPMNKNNTNVTYERYTILEHHHGTAAHKLSRYIWTGYCPLGPIAMAVGIKPHSIMPITFQKPLKQATFMK